MLESVRSAGGRIRRPDSLLREVGRADVVIDAVFGTGFHGPPEGPALEAIRALVPSRSSGIILVTSSDELRPFLRRLVQLEFPTLMVLYRGEVIARQPGAAPLNILRSWLDDAIARIPSESDLEAH